MYNRCKETAKHFKEVAESLFRKAMSEKGSCNRVDLAFDVCKQKSIKPAERRNRD